MLNHSEIEPGVIIQFTDITGSHKSTCQEKLGLGQNGVAIEFKSKFI